LSDSASSASGGVRHCSNSPEAGYSVPRHFIIGSVFFTNFIC
jgi:hypothetical protein